MTATLASRCAFDLEIQSVFSGHWPSPSSSSPSSSLSLATTERDAADGQPAFRHHQCRLGDGRRATWPDRRKRQGEHNLFFFSLSDQRQTPEISPAAWPDSTANGGGSYHPSSGSSLIPPSSGTSVFLPVDCSLWLQPRRGDRYSSHHLFNVIPEYELYKMIPLVFNKPRRLNWAHLRKTSMKCSASLGPPNEGQCSVHLPGTVWRPDDDDESGPLMSNGTL